MPSTQIGFVLATISIAAFHVSLPDHWLPFVLVGRAQKWSRTKTIAITALAGLGHITMTSLLGFLVALIGVGVLKKVEGMEKFFAGIPLILFGAIYTILDVKRHRSHQYYKVDLPDRVAVFSLIGMLTLSPCVAVIPIFFAASPMGLKILLPLSIILTVATIGGMVLITSLAYTGLEKLRFSRIEKYERTNFGVILILLGITVVIF